MMPTGFLYSILGWSAWVGLGVMTALMPIPALTSRLINGVQKKKMAAVRVSYAMCDAVLIYLLDRCSCSDSEGSTRHSAHGQAVWYVNVFWA
jgi:hypothetical protein